MTSSLDDRKLTAICSVCGCRAWRLADESDELWRIRLLKFGWRVDGETFCPKH